MEGEKKDNVWLTCLKSIIQTNWELFQALREMKLIRRMKKKTERDKEEEDPFIRNFESCNRINEFALVPLDSNTARFRLRNRDHHTLELRSQNNLASEPWVFVQNSSPRIPFQNVLFIIRRGRELVKPFLRDVRLAFGRTRINLLESMRRRIDQSVVCTGFQESMAWKSDDFSFFPRSRRA